jgi:opacity protein-like surface antigen
MLAILAVSITHLSAQTLPLGPVAPATSPVAGAVSRWSISLSFGAAFPVGAFSSKRTTDSASSFAKTGPQVDLGLDYRITAHLGLSLTVNGQENATDNKTIARQLEASNPNTQYFVSIAHWKIGRALAGVWAETALDKEMKWSVRGRLAAGALLTKPPKMSLATYQTGSGMSGPKVASETNTYPKDLWAFAWQAGAGLKYTLTPQWSFHVDAGYSASSVSIYSFAHRSIEQIGAANGSGTLGTGTGTVIILGSTTPLPTFKLPLNTATLSVGAAFSF